MAKNGLTVLRGVYGEGEDGPPGLWWGDPVRGGVKAAFKQDATRYLRAVGAELSKAGWETERVTFNPAGPAVSGDAVGVFYRRGRDEGATVYVCQLHAGGWGGKVSPWGVSVMFRSCRRSGGPDGANCWDADWNETAGELAVRLVRLVGGA